MESQTSRMLTGIILVTTVVALFCVSAAMRIRNAWRKLQGDSESRGRRILRGLDILFSTIVLVASLVFFSIFIANAGR